MPREIDLLNLGSINTRQHHAITKPWFRSVVVGGPYENRTVAEAEKVLISLNEADFNIPQANETVITSLEIGDSYVLKGSADTLLIHGVNDGFHGSKLLDHPLRNIIADKLLSLFNQAAFE
ncbi:hypothetical protein HY383_03315 [Candidatus Daviesbacteria bacterium]|nr:hypothetical protein [Candidatus Daviesbacteria bacterium]